MHLKDQPPLEGDVVWVDATFIKLRPSGSDTSVLVPKAQVQRLEAIAGTEAIARDEVAADKWAGRRADLA